MVFWLGAWTIGGPSAMATVRRIFQRPVPEMITLEADGLVHDSGIPPVQLHLYRTRRPPPWSDLFPKRTIGRIDRSALETLRLREGDTANRLTVDNGANRIDLAKAATDVEREWLYRALRERYSISAPAEDGER